MFALLSPARWLALIAAIYVALAVAFGVVNPLFEAPDEHKHYFVAQRIAEEERLPYYDADDPDPWTLQEAAQPPLYYLMGSSLIDPAAVGDARDAVWPNPFARIGDASFPSNHNAFVHGPAEGWPWTGYAAAAHRLRLLSTLLGLGTLLCIYATGRLLWPGRPGRALLATGLVAFLPQFVFLHAAVTNDSLITLLSTAVLWQVVRLWTRPAEEEIGPVTLLALGVTVGLAALTKNQGAALIPYGWLGVTAVARQRGVGVAGWLRWSALILAPALAAVGWLWSRNWGLYGDPTAASVFVAVAGGTRAFTVGEALAEWPGLLLSTVGVFGWFNVRAAGWVYGVWAGLAAIGILGGVAGWLGWWGLGAKGEVMVGRRRLSEASLRGGWLAGWVVVVLAALVVFLLQTTAAQGRLLFPALLPPALGVAYGLDQRPWRRARPLFLAAALATAVFSVAVTIPAAYRSPTTIGAAAIPATAARLDADLGKGITLLAAEVETTVSRPGDFVFVTLYWRAETDLPIPADKEETRDYVIELFGREDALVGKLQSYPGAGRYPAALWPVGEVVVERTAVPLDATLAVPTEASLILKWADSTAPGVVAGRIKIIPPEWPVGEGSPLARLGEGIEMIAAQVTPARAAPGETAIVDVTWRVTAPPDVAYTTFVHLGPPGETPLATGDSPPLGGHYPTRLWAAGEVIVDRYEVVVPVGLGDGRYPLRLGLYDPMTGVRLPLTVDGSRQADDSFVAGYVVVGVQP